MTNYLESRWQIAAVRIKPAVSGGNGKSTVNLSFEIAAPRNLIDLTNGSKNDAVPEAKSGAASSITN